MMQISNESPQTIPAIQPLCDHSHDENRQGQQSYTQKPSQIFKGQEVYQQKQAKTDECLDNINPILCRRNSDDDKPDIALSTTEDMQESQCNERKVNQTQPKPLSPIDRLCLLAVELQLPQLTDARHCEIIEEYCGLVIESKESDAYDCFIEHSMIAKMMRFLRKTKYSSQSMRITFSSLSFLLYKLRQPDQLYFLLININREGFISEKYCPAAEEDYAYLINLLKALVRQICTNSEMFPIFISSTTPQFPLVLLIMKHFFLPIANGEPVMQTAAKLAILSMAQLNQPQVQNYLQQFPFVIVFVYASMQINWCVHQLISESTSQPMKEIAQERLTSHLHFMEQLLNGKTSQMIHMYANSFYAIVGKGLFKMLCLKGSALLSILDLIKLIKDSTQVKPIHDILLILLSERIQEEHLNALNSPLKIIEENNWFTDKYPSQVRQHCKCVLFPQSNQSFVKGLFQRMSEYLPQRWFLSQLSIISSIIGRRISTHSPLDLAPLPDSYEWILGRQVGAKMCQNPLFSHLLNRGQDKLVHAFLLVLIELTKNSSPQQYQLVFSPLLRDRLVQCHLFEILQCFNKLVVSRMVRISMEMSFVRELFQQLLSKLVCSVMKEGWKYIHIQQNMLSARFREESKQGNGMSRKINEVNFNQKDRGELINKNDGQISQIGSESNSNLTDSSNILCTTDASNSNPSNSNPSTTDPLTPSPRQSYLDLLLYMTIRQLLDVPNGKCQKQLSYKAKNIPMYPGIVRIPCRIEGQNGIDGEVVLDGHIVRVQMASKNGQGLQVKSGVAQVKGVYTIPLTTTLPTTTPPTATPPQTIYLQSQLSYIKISTVQCQKQYSLFQFTPSNSDNPILLTIMICEDNVRRYFEKQIMGRKRNISIIKNQLRGLRIKYEQ